MSEESRKFYIADLIRARREFANLQVPAIRVDVTIQLSLPDSGNKAVKGKAPNDIKDAIAKMNGKAKQLMPQLEKAARESLDQVEKELIGELRNKEKMCIKFADQRRVNDIVRAATEANDLLEKAVSDAKAALKKVVEYTKAKETRGNDLLSEAKLKTSVTFSGITIKSKAPPDDGKGEDIGKSLEFANNLKKVGTQVQQNLNNELRLRKSFVSSVVAYLKFLAAQTTQTPQQDAAKVKEAAATAKAEFAEVEKTMQLYQEHIVKIGRELDKVFEQADHLINELQKHPKLAEIGKVRMECARARLKAVRLKSTLDSAQTQIKGIGLTVNRAIIVQKVKALDVGYILSEGAEVISGLNSTCTQMSKVASMAKKKGSA